MENYQQYDETQQNGYQTKMGFNDAVTVCLRDKFATLQGRATRTEFWYFVLLNFIISVAISLSSFLINSFLSTEFYFVFLVLYILIILGLAIPTICVTVRRLHDIGLCGWWCCISLIPYLLSFCSLIFMNLHLPGILNKFCLVFAFISQLIFLILMLLKSQPKDNDYGSYIQ